jgi:hypothetical protein
MEAAKRDIESIKLVALKDLIDFSGKTKFFVPEGSVMDLITDMGNFYLCSWGKWVFPVLVEEAQVYDDLDGEIFSAGSGEELKPREDLQLGRDDLWC